MLDLLAEDSLSHAERTEAEAHLRHCARCASELEASRSVIAALDGLPRFEPSPAFSQAVMSRVVPARLAAAEARSRRWLPATRKGWIRFSLFSLLPIAPLATLLAWLLSHPMVTPGALWEIASERAGAAAWSLLAGAADLVARSGAVGWVADLAARVAAAPTETALALLAAGVAIPLSGWTLARLLRTPTGAMTHAH